ncbi:hypothetical protein [Photobacterium rosenbergii]|uniref:hypothetical protein n=1 Tax=Photobacterium rosenbergii TaxID=294936 RepID=UPI0021BD4CD9|nr:hypothetical protein [Photobacterium rosenbergii]
MIQTDKLISKPSNRALSFSAFALLVAFPEMVLAEELKGSAPQQQVQQVDVFEQYQISKDIPKYALSSLVQASDLVEHVKKTVTYNGESETSEVYLVQSIDHKGNIDLRVKYDEKKLSKNEDVLDQIAKLTRNEYRLRDFADSYDKKSVTHFQTGPNSAVINFNYSKFGLPQDVAYFRFMRVKLFLEHGKVSKMEVRNSQPFTFAGYKIDDYLQVITFETLDDTSDIVMKEKVITAKGERKNKPIELEYVTTPVAHYDDNGMGVVVLDQTLMSEVSDPRYREERVDLDRTFPLMGDMIRRKGIDLPMPYGVSLAYRDQDLNMDLTSFSVFGLDPNFIAKFFDPDKTTAKINAKSVTLRGDVNILPFWNVFGYIGQIDINAKVKTQFNGNEEPICVVDCNLLEIPEMGAVELNIPIHLRYSSVGVGTTLAVGYKNLFASATATFTKTKLDGADDWGDGIMTYQPLIGYQLPDYRAQIFVGAEYQDYDDFLDGEVNFKVGGLPVTMPYHVGIDVDRWTYTVGFNKELGKSYNITGMYSTGEDRTSVTLNLGYRF